MKRSVFANIMCTLLIAFVTCSCSAPKYLPGPTVHYPGLKNTCTFGVQNMDSEGKPESNSLVCHYNGFDIRYEVKQNFLISLTIINNSNKSLIIDKSKSYVLYDGYSTELFKDVRSSRSTTFNNVQDAINNVQTNEAGVSMTIPPYSKWELPLKETNLRVLKELPEFNTEVGYHPITSFDNKETVEFVLPYSFDYSLAKWSTCRNRIYVNSIETEAFYREDPIVGTDAMMISAEKYALSRPNGVPAELIEASKIDEINQKMYMKHSRKVAASRRFWCTVLLIPTCFTSGIGYSIASDIAKDGCDNHRPFKYVKRRSSEESTGYSPISSVEY